MADFEPTKNQESSPSKTPEDPGAKDVDAESMADDALRRVEAVAEELRSQAAVQADHGMEDFGPPNVGLDATGVDLSMLHDVDLHVTIELGRTRMVVEDVVRLNADSVIELDKAAGDPVDVYVNGRHVARGEVLVLNDNFCIRVSEILPLGMNAAHMDEPAAKENRLETVD
ncbi:MAG: flagellar motor switch protein FliN [Phycisphaerales bacterium]|nr:flagellar motor switch protein FliN [Phycisphaerales bacterium]